MNLTKTSANIAAVLAVPACLDALAPAPLKDSHTSCASSISLRKGHTSFVGYTWVSKVPFFGYKQWQCSEYHWSTCFLQALWAGSRPLRVVEGSEISTQNGRTISPTGVLTCIYRML